MFRCSFQSSGLTRFPSVGRRAGRGNESPLRKLSRTDGGRPVKCPFTWGARPMKSIPRLPEHPGLAAYGDLAGSLRLLGCPHMAAFVLAGEPVQFRVLDGVWVKAGRFSWHRVDSSYLEQVRLGWRKDTDSRRRAAADHVLILFSRRYGRVLGIVAANPVPGEKAVHTRTHLMRLRAGCALRPWLWESPKTRWT